MQYEEALKAEDKEVEIEHPGIAPLYGKLIYVVGDFAAIVEPEDGGTPYFYPIEEISEIQYIRDIDDPEIG